MELEQRLKQIDIAPLINIILLLFLFFMLSSGFVMQAGIKVNLPKAVTSEAVKYDVVEILVTYDSSLYFDGKILTSQSLKALFKQAAKRNQAILIKADRRASLGRVVEIWDMARGLGITHINIATNQE